MAVQAPRLISEAAGLSGEHWAEKVAAELGNLLGISVAQVELAEIEGRPGSLSRNIRAGDHEAIVHGNELLAGHVTGYDKDRKRGQKEHTWRSIQAAIRTRCGDTPCAEILSTFAGVLGAGRMDRQYRQASPELGTAPDSGVAWDLLHDVSEL